VLVPGGRKHPGPPPALTVRAAGRSGSWSQALQNGSTRSCGGGQANDTGCSAGLSRVGHYAFAHAGSGICRPVRFCPRAYGASAPGTVPLAGSEHQNSGPTECAETAGSVRGAVVHAVCPRSLTVAEVGRRRRFGRVAFGCGWKRTRRASPKRLRATGEGASEAGARASARLASQELDRAPRRRKASRIGNPPLLQWFGGANDLRSQGFGLALTRSIGARRRRGVRTQPPFVPLSR